MNEHAMTVQIVVNGAPHDWPKGSITFAEVVTLDVSDYPQHPERSYSVKYRRGPNENHEGILSPSGSVRVKEGMVFSVTETGQS